MSIAEKLEGIVDKVYEQGKKAFSEAFANFGKRKSFQYAFQYTNFENVTFPVKIQPTSAGSVFQWYRGATLPKNIDFSECVFASDVTAEAKVPHKMFFESTDIKRIDDISLPVQYRYPYTFFGCKGLEEIEVLRVCPDTTFYHTFTSCSKLKEIRFEGQIGQNIDLGVCPLTAECLVELVLSLYDYMWDYDRRGEYMTHTLIISNTSYKKVAGKELFGCNCDAECTCGFCTIEEALSKRGWNLAITNS